MTRSVFLRTGLAMACLAALPARALAQNATNPPPAAQTPPTPTFVTRWNNGLSFESTDGDNKIQLGTLLQVDGRFAANDPSPITDSFLIRRGRILLSGRVQKHFEFLFAPDFSGGVLTLFDAYVDTTFGPSFRVRLGKAKSPVGLEALYPDAALPFAERSLGNNLVPNRDLGVRAMGDLFHGQVSYVGGIENGVADGTNGDTDTNGGKDLVGRLTLRIGPGGVGVGASHGHETATPAGFKSTAQQTFISYAAGVAADGARNRVSPAAFLYRGPVGAFVEYFRTAQTLAKGGVRTDVVNTGWNATAIVVVTGERASENGVAPKRPFDPENGQWGALQIAVRLSSITMDQALFSAGLAAPGASRTAKAGGVSLIWYDTANIKHVFTFERTVFDGHADGPRRAENAIIFRIQLNLAPRL